MNQKTLNPTQTVTRLCSHP